MRGCVTVGGGRSRMGRGGGKGLARPAVGGGRGGGLLRNLHDAGDGRHLGACGGVARRGPPAIWAPGRPIFLWMSDISLEQGDPCSLEVRAASSDWAGWGLWEDFEGFPTGHGISAVLSPPGHLSCFFILCTIVPKGWGVSLERSPLFLRVWLFVGEKKVSWWLKKNRGVPVGRPERGPIEVLWLKRAGGPRRRTNDLHTSTCVSRGWVGGPLGPMAGAADVRRGAGGLPREAGPELGPGGLLGEGGVGKRGAEQERSAWRQGETM